ncbi:NAD-dependent epimerase/dehydratase family protein [Gluconacetobacter sacchari]|uniref:NAD-dependent epimerase/dehydratase family protein n=2 Tax=Gluconacetobacter sacchari TaxID=92759 RepID=A0A7W4NS34_9PROT|nr:NAD-dependent epimerase/dehydratase family protein [Gluconacetobacter sacchari]MBB2161668.1 NAD-dependent epimerase/dehydratase family protein [Gluconacetobacter sacchari]GBQ19217.1 NAD-dependent epimerase/dehydratase [Gluconacetobacter sacchari DSM 12717]
MTALPMAGRTCLVLGAGGFIGQALVDRLVEEGGLVRAYGRPPRLRDADPHLDWRGYEFSDESALARAVDGCDYVFHLIGGTLPESANRNPEAEILGSVNRTIHLLDLCRTAGVRKLVFASSGGTVYGIPKHVPIRETMETFPISAYGIAKLTIEKFLYLYEYLHGLNSVALRIANPFGPYQDPGKKQGIIAAAIASIFADRPVEIWGDGTVVRDFIYIDDVISAFIAAAVYDGPERIFNIGSGIGRSINDVVASVGRAMGVEAPRRIYRQGRASDVPVNVLDIALARRELAWAPTADWAGSLRVTAERLKALQAPQPSIRPI